MSSITIEPGSLKITAFILPAFVYEIETANTCSPNLALVSSDVKRDRLLAAGMLYSYASVFWL
jgi:hypothetical protein